MLGASVDEVWAATREFWSERDPAQVAEAEARPEAQDGAVFRWYLGLSSRWANAGDADAATRLPDLVRPGDGRVQRVGAGIVPRRARRTATVAQVALNLLEGAAVVTRAQQLRTYGVPVPPEAFDYRPRPLDDDGSTATIDRRRMSTQ